MADLYFPQLAGGSVAQFPLTKRLISRTIHNVLADGRFITSQDVGARKISWRLSYRELGDADMQALLEFFRSCKGPLTPFSYIDPTGNMLQSSGDFSSTAWIRTPGPTVGNAVLDPVGGNNAVTLTNQLAAAVDLSQLRSAPAGYQYCLSGYFRSDAPGLVELFLKGSSASSASAFSIGPTWTRVVHSVKMTDQSNTLTAGLTLAAGQRLEVYGLQLEPQPAPAVYKATTGASSIYPQTYWAQTEFKVRTDGAELHSVEILLESVR